MAATSIVCNSQGLFAAAVAVFYFSDFFRKMPDQTDQSILHRPSFPARLHEYAISGLDLFLFLSVCVCVVDPPFHLPR